MIKDNKKPRTERFQNAIRNSLEELLQSGERITKAKVVRNARFENGKKVGQTTIYSKHETTGDFVHAKLLREINKTVESQRKKKTGKTRAESLVGLKKDLANLKVERDVLIDQLAEQEARLQNSENDSEGAKGIASTQETELYVLSKIIAEITHGAVGEIKDITKRYEVKYANDQRLEKAADEITRYLDDINNSRLIGLEGAKSLKSID